MGGTAMLPVLYLSPGLKVYTMLELVVDHGDLVESWCVLMLPWVVRCGVPESCWVGAFALA